MYDQQGAGGMGGMGGVDPSNMDPEQIKQAAQNMGIDPSKVAGADETLNMGDDDVVDADYEEVDDEDAEDDQE